MDSKPACVDRFWGLFLEVNSNGFCKMTKTADLGVPWVCKYVLWLDLQVCCVEKSVYVD